MFTSFKLLTTLLLISGSLVSGNKAPLITTNPKGVIAIADFPFGYDVDVTGNIVFTAKGGKSVNVHVDMTILPPAGGPFFYHIHEKSVPSDGNCQLAGSRFNPYNGSLNCCELENKAFCELGDLSGKHGAINDTSFEVNYDDPYLSLNKKSKSYIVGKSITFHYANMTTFACADIELAGNLRLHNLLEEYAESGNTDLDYIIEDLTSPEQFDEDKCLLDEIFEDNLPLENNEGERKLQDDNELSEGENNTDSPLVEEHVGDVNEINDNESEKEDHESEEDGNEKYFGDEKPWKYKFNFTNSTNESQCHKNSTYSLYSEDYENGSSIRSLTFELVMAALFSLLI